MSKTVVVTIEATSTKFPAGTVAAGIQVTLSGGVIPAQTVTAAPYTASFEAVPVGSYTATAQTVDANGAPIGPAAVSAEFTIADDEVSIDIPSTVTVTIGA